jgi:phosphotransferase system enzyme I (PtsP)
LGIGFRQLSITPAAIGPIKELICKVDLEEIGAAMDRWLAEPPTDIRGAIHQWAIEHGIETE